jgi:K+-sensing histidine kinase KdpD
MSRCWTRVGQFYRVQRPLMPSGTGLGLTMCRGLVEAHGGQMWAANRPGGGTVVRFTLPPPGTSPSVALEEDMTGGPFSTSSPH